MARARNGNGRKKVLLVFESKPVLSSTAEVVDAWGFKSYCASMPETALSQLDQFGEIEVVAIRHGNKIDGPRLLGQIRARYPAVKVILVGGCETVGEALALGADGFVATAGGSFKIHELKAVLLQFRGEAHD